jgi:hypothetical protein
MHPQTAYIPGPAFAVEVPAESVEALRSGLLIVALKPVQVGLQFVAVKPVWSVLTLLASDLKPRYTTG